MKSTYSSTNSLRGIGILAVLINHYLNVNVTGEFRGFASLWVAVFFIVSGYGISCSLNHSFKQGPYTIRNILVFYYNRTIRILPLFFLALVVESLVRSNGSTILMVPGIHYSGHYWFVPSILQCYVVAPLVFLSIRYNRIGTVYGSIILFIIFNYIINSNYFPNSVLRALYLLHSDYMDLFFLNILIFSLSMCLPSYIENWINVSVIEKNTILLILFVFIMLGMLSFKYDHKIPFIYILMKNSLYSLALIFIMAVYIISNNISCKMASFLGEISYSIYLFHKSVYIGIDMLFGYGMNSLIEFLICLVLVFLFLILCIYIEKAGRKITHLMKI